MKTINAPTRHFTPEQYGNAGVQDCSIELTAMFADVAEAGGGTIELAGRLYRYTSGSLPISIPSNTRIIGIPGKSGFDFSQRSAFDNLGPGLMAAKGELGPEVELTRDAKRFADIAPLIVSINRSDGTATATTTTAHGLCVGEYVLITGAGGSIPFELKGFTSVTATNVPEGNPFKVTAVPNEKTFQYMVPETLQPTYRGAALRLYPGGRILTMADTTIFSDHDMVLISSQQVRSKSTSEVCPIGEINYVARVVNRETLLLKYPVRDTYRVSDSAIVQTITPKTDIIIEGVRFIGKGANVGAGWGDEGVVFDLCRNVVVRNCSFKDIDRKALEFRTSDHCEASGNLIEFDTRDVAGRVGLDADVSYGVQVYGASQNIIFRGNTVYGGRHAFAQANAKQPTDSPGICRNVHVIDNHLYGCWQAAISTHLGHDTLIIARNIIEGGDSGISLRYGRGAIIADNIVQNCTGNGIDIVQRLGSVTVRGNVIDRCKSGIVISLLAEPSYNIGDLILAENQITNSAVNGVALSTNAEGVLLRNLVFSENIIKNCGADGLAIQVGRSAATLTAFIARISGNQISNVGLTTGGSSGMNLVNARRSTIESNSIADADGTMSTRWGIVVSGRFVADNLIRNNLIEGVTIEPIKCSGANNTITSLGMSAIAMLDFPEIPPGACAELTITVPGAVINDPVSVGPPAFVPPGVVLCPPRVSASDTVSVGLCNVSTSPVSPGPQTWQVTVMCK